MKKFAKPFIVLAIFLLASWFFGYIFLSYFFAALLLVYTILTLFLITGKKGLKETKKSLKEMDKHEAPGPNTKPWGKALKQIGEKTGEQIVKSDEPWGSHRTGTRIAKGSKSLIEQFKELFE